MPIPSYSIILYTNYITGNNNTQLFYITGNNNTQLFYI